MSSNFLPHTLFSLCSFVMPKPRQLFTQALNQTPDTLASTMVPITQPPVWLFYTCTHSETTLIWVQLHRRADWVAEAEKRAFNSPPWSGCCCNLKLDGKEAKKMRSVQKDLLLLRLDRHWLGGRTFEGPDQSQKSFCLLFAHLLHSCARLWILDGHVSSLLDFFNLYYVTLLNRLVNQRIPAHTCSFLLHFLLFDHGGD